MKSIDELETVGMIRNFRVYDKHLKLMKEVVAIDFKSREIEYPINDDGVTIQRSFDEVNIMQSTGLFDKNGIEIFEGDMVRNLGIDYTPIFKNGIYMALNIEKLKLDECNRFFPTQFNCVWRDGCVVIGNIYENKELLGDE